MRLTNGVLWPMPITLDVSAEQAAKLKIGDRLSLVDNSTSEGLDLAVLTVESIWQPDKAREAELVFGANDRAHPSVAYLWDEAGSHYVGGKVEGIVLPPHYDFVSLRRNQLLSPIHQLNLFNRHAKGASSGLQREMLEQDRRFSDT